MAEPKRLGRQTPTASAVLPYTQTHGQEAVDLQGELLQRQGKGREWVIDNNEIKGRINFNEEYSQNYRPVTRGEAKMFTQRSGGEIVATRINGYNGNVFVSEKVTIKPKALHNINKATDVAAKAMRIDNANKPTINVASNVELNNVIAKYDATLNAILYSPLVGDRAKLIKNHHLHQGGIHRLIY